ncbi:TlpA family protein disulfide reductase [Hymenobacter setariae]|uniref:TlpA family protein disulfide reductase n=1 Tax=Hymenobacter setariae TaxID=2594794 RepID=A0A558C3R2_9BACT|nr:TlpA disulfide reductase family protein [Hymenobacter setariae]TVT43435.1 TlpA family protein disulfide reductase [Hymenobacter setariae]
MKVIPLVLLGAGLLAGCHSGTSTSSAETGTTSAATLLTPGPWRGELAIQGQQLPFLFEVKTEGGKPVVYLINKGLNGEERLRCDEISAAGDSATIRLHVFDAALVVRADGKDKLKGTWVKYDAKTPYRVPLTAEAGEPLVPIPIKDTPYLNGTWNVTFRDGENTYPAVGIFQQQDNQVTGTFLTSTGDYRYLSGKLIGQHLRLSTFDGSHAFLFEANDNSAKREIQLKSLTGDFYSGKSGHETWTATLDPKAKLPDADTLTYLKKGESRLNFKFPSVVQGGSISPTDPKYRGKVVVIQVLGSWCPNCMDETKFLAPWYEKNKARGVEIIGLGYERMPEYDQAAARLRQMKERLNVGYDLAVAGVSNKDSVAKSMPQLAKFLAFPTTIFLDKKGVVRTIHTGFSGPGTGKYYEEETARFNRTVDKLLKE